MYSCENEDIHDKNIYKLLTVYIGVIYIIYFSHTDDSTLFSFILKVLFCNSDSSIIHCKRLQFNIIVFNSYTYSGTIQKVVIQTSKRARDLMSQHLFCSF